MTDETDQQDNVVSLDKAREAKNENRWRVTGLKYMEKDQNGNPIQMMTRDKDGNQQIVRGILLHIQFLDREPSKLITVDGDQGHKGVNIPIPLGIPAEALYEMFRNLPETIQAHLDGVAPPNEPEAS